MANPDLSGTVLAGRYALTRPLGRGGMGTVYEARALDSHTEVAVKVLQDVTASHRSTDRFERELLALRRVTHPNVVRVLDDGVSAGGARWFTMERCPGVPLSRVIDGPRPAAEIDAIARQVLGALDAIHQQSLIHRDLKPGNVMVEHTAGTVFARILSRHRDPPSGSRDAPR